MENKPKDRAAVVSDLERRIEELESLNESAFGEFTHVDWVLCVLGGLVVPYAIYLWFWR